MGSVVNSKATTHVIYPLSSMSTPSSSTSRNCVNAFLDACSTLEHQHGGWSWSMESGKHICVTLSKYKLCISDHLAVMRNELLHPHPWIASTTWHFLHVLQQGGWMEVLTTCASKKSLFRLVSWSFRYKSSCSFPTSFWWDFQAWPLPTRLG